VTLMAGSFGSTSAHMGAEMASVLDSGTDLRILPVMGRGSVQAVADILLMRGVDAGIVRKDTLSYLERKEFAKNIRSQFVYVAKMFNEEMHVLAPQSIRSMKELDGKTVAVDLPDSSTFVTSINLFERLGIKPHLLCIEPRIALDMLHKGDIDAIIAVKGKPLQWLSEINDGNLHLVPVGYDKSLRDDYLPAQLSSEDYPNLISASNPIDTIAGEAVLASYNRQPGSDRYRRLALLVESLFFRMAQLQRPPFHPKWQELAPLAPVAGWTGGAGVGRSQHARSSSSSRCFEYRAGRAWGACGRRIGRRPGPLPRIPGMADQSTETATATPLTVCDGSTQILA
jgi:TRAP-type uncharacterized transport system substrate-binding protein